MKSSSPRATAALCGIFFLLALGALAVQWKEVPLDGVRLLPLGIAGGILGAALAALVFWRLSKLPRPFGYVSLWLLAGLFAGVMTLGQSFAGRGTTELLTDSMLKAALFFLGRVPLYYGAMVLAQRALGKGEAHIPRPPSRSSAFSLLFTRPRAWLFPSALLLLCWLPYYFHTFPGVVSNDSVTQLKEIFGILPLEAGNPVFQTLLLAAFARLGLALGSPDAGVALYCCFQGLFMALLLGRLLHVMATARVPRWLLWASLAFLALCPVFPLFAFCVGKDTNFAMAVLWFSLTVWRVLSLPPEQEKQARMASVRGLGLEMSLCAALVLLLRNPGAYLLALTLVPLLLWTLGRGPGKAAPPLWKAPASALGVTAALWLALHLLVLPSLPIAPMPEAEEYSLPLQQVARVVASQPESLSQEDRQVIGAVLEFDQIKARYQGELSDPIKLLWKESATAQQKQAFFGLWLRLAPRHAATYFSATFHNAYGYLCPGYLSVLKPTLLIGKQAHTQAIEPFFPFSVNPRSGALKGAMDALAATPLGRLVLAPGLYGWITLFALAVLLASRQKRLLLAAAPALFSLAGCLLSAVNGYFRYALPLYFSAPLLLALCACARSTKDKGETPA
ncbi:MAG: DUF6020 family protein [Candidatus Limiplasma sp.]|nr:DUF6020 family protein [Candidatus Limiplasma sp.]